MGEMKLHDHAYSQEQMSVMIDKMYEAANAFYPKAGEAGCHAFIEFAGLMREFIKMCEESQKAGIEFPMANEHNEIALVMKPYHAMYLAEKFGCVFAATFKKNPEQWKLFVRAMENKINV